MDAFTIAKGQRPKLDPGVAAFIDVHSATIEVEWGGQIVQVFFSLPPYSRFLQESKKKQFLDEIRLDSLDKAEERLRELLHQSTHRFHHEMKEIYNFSNQVL